MCQASTNPAKENERPVIAQVVGTFAGGGAERVAANLALGLASTKQVRSVCIALRKPGAFVQDRPELDVFSLGVTSRLTALARVAALRKMIREEGIHLLHVHGHSSLPFVALTISGMRPRPKLWFTWHTSIDVLESSRFEHRLMKWALRRCDLVWGASSSIVARIGAELADAPPLAVFANGVGPHPRTSAQQDDLATILWMARLVPSKKADVAIHAASEMFRRGYRFKLILAGGAGSHMDWHRLELESLIKTNGLEGVVEMPGWVDDIQPWLMKANIGLQTSSNEGLSLSLLEQMMAGHAIIASDVGDTATAVIDGETGFLYQHDDQKALEALLEKLLSDPALRRSMGEKARARCQAKFSIAAMAERELAAFCDPSANLQQGPLNEEAYD